MFFYLFVCLLCNLWHYFNMQQKKKAAHLLFVLPSRQQRQTDFKLILLLWQETCWDFRVLTFGFLKKKVIFWLSASRYVPPMDSDYYEGTGYGRVIIDKITNVILIGMSVRTHSENGLLLYIGNEVNYCLWSYFINLMFWCTFYRIKGALFKNLIILFLLHRTNISLWRWRRVLFLYVVTCSKNQLPTTRKYSQ